MNDYKPVLGLMAVVVVASGCAVLAMPDPEIVDSSQEQGVLEAVQGTTTVTAEVRNNGEAGNVTANVVILDENDTVLSRQAETFYMDAGETRQISIDIDTPEEAANYRINVEPAQ